MVNNYNMATAGNLSQLYKNGGSYVKRMAERQIRDMMKTHGGYGLRMWSHTTQCFTAAYKYIKDGAEHLVYFTPYNTYDIVIPA